VVVVVGPSGSGKSTLLRCINGLEPFESGEVHVFGSAITPATHAGGDARTLAAVRRRVGMVFQQLHLFPHRSVLSNLLEAPVYVLGEPREAAAIRANVLLDRLGLAGRADARPRQLSGGEQQRVAIARALMMKPEALLFDEPTSALDPVLAAEILAILRDLASSGQTLMVVTHALHFARAVATEVHVFAGGQSVEQGPPERIFQDPQHDLTRSLLRSFPA
jgi:ABC-type polar amino acid transport system ATPase subunit